MTKIIITFESNELDRRGFDILCSTQDKFYYVGNKKYQINQTQKNALDIQGIPYKEF